MREIDALSRLPLPTQPVATIECDEILFQELIVAREVAYAIGSTHKLLPKDTKAGEVRRTFTGRLTEAGLARLAALQAKEIRALGEETDALSRLVTELDTTLKEVTGE